MAQNCRLELIEEKQNFWQILLLEIVYVLVDTSQNQKKKTLFFPASHAPRNWATAPKYTQKPWEGSEVPPASEMGCAI